MQLALHVLSFPYVRWHIIFIILPSIVFWLWQGKYLLRYKKTYLYATILALLYGIPADIFASPILKLWYFQSQYHLGNFYFNLPLGEYVFILLAPQLLVSILLVVRKYAYVR